MGPLIRNCILAILLACAAATRVSAQAPAAPPPNEAKIPLSKIPRVHRAPKLEDFLENHPREAELTVTDFRQNIPGDGTPATESTTAYLSYDEKNLYAVFLCHDEAGQVTADGYIVFFSIPFKSLRFSNEPDQTWGVALYRVILRKSEYDYWPYITQRVEGITQQFEAVGGLDHVSPGRNMQFIPYGLLAGDHFLNQPTLTSAGPPPAYQDAFEHRAGLDAKFVAKDSLTFDVTLNPDFSQVESDDPQVTVNQRFAVLFPEKRPFFIENAGFFQTPVDLFFSRQIADPQFGARMTGKAGDWTLGALVIDDRQPGQGQTVGSEYDTRSLDGVVRIARQFGTQSYIGAFASTRDFADTSNRIVSLDARLKLSPHWVTDFQATHSWTRQDINLPQLCQQFEPPVQTGASPANASSQQGNSLYADVSYTSRKFRLLSEYSDFTPGFCAELGFVPRVDIRQSY